MKLILLFTLFASCYSASLTTKKGLNAPFCSVVRTKYDRTNVYRRNFVLKDKRWPNSTVVYELDSGLSGDDMLVITEAIDLLEAQTCIKWRQRVGQEKPYVLITSRYRGCWAHIGVPDWGYHSTLNLQQQRCTATHIAAHEMLHIMGMDHEQNRPDRDQHVTVNWENIRPGKAHNFYKDRTATSNAPLCQDNPGLREYNSCTSTYVTETFGVPYDIKSIMHYEGRSFSRDYRLYTMVPKNSHDMIVTNKRLSGNDLLKINNAYCNGKPFPTAGPIPCKDAIMHCKQYVCDQHPAYAKKYCKHTCGLCDS